MASLRVLLQRFDVVDCCGFPFFSLFSARLAVLLRGGYLASTCHEVWGRPYWRQYLGPAGSAAAVIEKLALKTPSSVFAVSDATASRLDALFGVRAAAVIPNGTNVHRIKSVRPADNRADIIYVGRLCDFKRVDLLLDALPYLLEEKPSTRLCIVGSGPAAEELRAHAAGLGISESVEFVGSLESDEEVYGRMKASRVFASMSSREGFGIAILEAYACGIPVIVANFPENAAMDLVRPGLGIVCAPEAKVVAGHIAKLLAEPTSLSATEALMVEARRVDWDLIAQDYLRALRACVRPTTKTLSA